MADSTNVNFGTLINVVKAHATTYEAALESLQSSANSSKVSYHARNSDDALQYYDENGQVTLDETRTVGEETIANQKVEKYNLGQVSITNATVATTKVQLTQSLTEMASGIAKNAADHTKGLGRKIGGG
jgi:Mn-containing catalase